MNSVDGGGFDLDGGVTNSVVEYSLSFFNAGNGFLVCQFDGNILPVVNNTIRYSVSYLDNMATPAGANFVIYAPEGADMTVATTSFYGNTIVSSSQGQDSPLMIVFPNTKGVSVHANAFLALSGKEMAQLNGAKGSASLNNNSYWAAGAALRFSVDGSSYKRCINFISLFLFLYVIFFSLKALQSATGMEETGTDADPQLLMSTSFFLSCVPQSPAHLPGSVAAYPLLPNSPFLDLKRNFNGQCL